VKRIPYKYRFTYGYFQLVDKLLGRKRGFALTKKFRKKFYDTLHTALKASGKGKLIEVERVRDISLKDFKRKYVARNKPVVIEGAAKEWGCVRNWSIDYFQELHGEDEVTIVANDTTQTLFEILKLKDVLNNIRSGGSKYFRFYPLLEKHPEHIKDFNYTWLKKAKNKIGFLNQFQVFIGGKGTYTPLHNAMGSNLFVQAFGTKEWILYPPSISAVIDPSPGVNFHRSAPFKTKEGPFNPFKPAYESPYHLYEYIDRIKVTLQPGDILFNPPHYWHAVQNPTDSIGVGFRWVSPAASFLTTPWYTILDLLDAPFNKHIYKDLKKDYIYLLMKELGTYDEYMAEKNKRQYEKKPSSI